jgi:threonine dehydrogenase-like Zn-dependent dehydrogenase
MRALVFEQSLPRFVATRLLAVLTPRAYVGPTAPIQLREIAEPRLPAGDWLLIRTHMTGLCGSDYKQVFLRGNLDNPMTSVISFPQVLGHEVVGVVERVGPDVRERKVGDRVVLNPWLSCAPRGLPLCTWCQTGDLAQCLSFRRGTLAPGIHQGNSSTAPGGFAPFLPAHESQCIPIPDGVDDAHAVLADPFAVSLHAILRNPPRDGAALVYGCGTLGLTAIAILRALAPATRVLAVARYPHQALLARQLGAERVFAHAPQSGIVEGVGEAVRAELHIGWHGLPMLNGGVGVVYDTIASADTLEVGVRVTRSRGRIVAIGVDSPRRFEWTPLYFKEIAIVGASGFGIEELDGRRQHAIAWYLELVATGRVDVGAIVTHRFPLCAWRDAFLCCWDQGASEAVKVLFEF